MKYELTIKDSKNSKYGKLPAIAMHWYWEEYTVDWSPTNNFGKVFAKTIQEAELRIKEALPKITGHIKFILPDEYYAHCVREEMEQAQKTNAKKAKKTS